MNKRKNIVLGIILLLVMMPVAGMLLAPTLQDNVLLPNESFSPKKDFGISADCAVDTTNTKITTATIDDTDNLYGGLYKTYTLVVNTSYAGGGSAIDNITALFWKDSTSYFSFKYLNSTGVVSEVLGPTYVELGAYSNVTSGNYVNLTINFKVEWAMPTVSDVDLNITVWNAVNSTTSKKDANYDFISTLTMTPTSFINLLSTKTGDTIPIADTTIVYQDSGGDNYPLEAQLDLYLTRVPASGGVNSWSPSSYTEGTGVAVWADVTAGSIAQRETFTISAYPDGTTTGDLFDTTYTDSLELTNAGGRVYESVTGDWMSDPNAWFMIGLVVVAGYFIYQGFFAGGKAVTTKKRVSKSRKTKGRKKR